MASVRSIWAESRLYRVLLIAGIFYFLLRLAVQSYLFAYAVAPEAIAEGTLVSGDLQFSYIPASQHFQAREDIYLKGSLDIRQSCSAGPPSWSSPRSGSVRYPAGSR